MKNLCELSTVSADRADLGSTETAEQKLKYATFEGGFSAFQGKKMFYIIFLKNILASALKICII